MRSDYERKKYRKIYSLISLAFLTACLIWSCFSFGELTWKTCGLVLMFIAFSVIIYLISYHHLDKVYSEMENISEIMDRIMTEGEEPPTEDFKEGIVGILYTNFYKMVEGLKESRNRELQEKVFLRDIISDISHQLKTPLASLTVFIDLLLEDKVEDKGKQRKILEEASNQLSRMEWMVLSMLKLARIEAGAIQFDKQEVSLETVFMQAKEGVQFLLKEREQKLVIECETGKTLLCDGDWLAEAIINLLKNASDYSDNGKTIWVQVETSKVYTRIYIKDEGRGIPEEELPNIFKRFYRVNQEVNPNSVGIGLSLTKSIIEGMGGTIRVKSEEEKYTWFTITFVK